MYSYRGAHVNLLVSNQHGTKSTPSPFLYSEGKKMGTKILMPIQQFFSDGRYVSDSCSFLLRKKAGGNNKMTNDSKSANGCLPSTHPLAYSQKPLKARGQNKGIMGGRFVYLTLGKKHPRSDESNCCKSQSSYLIKTSIFGLDGVMKTQNVNF